MWRSIVSSLSQPGVRSALLLAMALAILPPPPPTGSGAAPAPHSGERSGAVDVVRGIAGIYKRRAAHQRVPGRVLRSDRHDIEGTR